MDETVEIEAQSYIGKKVRFPKGSNYDLKDGCGVVESVGPGSARVSVRESRTGQSWDVHWLLLERVKEGNNGSHRR